MPATATNIHPEGIGTDAIGNLYISDTTRAIRKVTISTGLITRIAGTGDNISSPYCGNGSIATSCHIGPLGIAVDDAGNVYIADESNSIIEKVDVLGIIHTVAGNGTFTHTGDNGPATTAGVNWPEGVTLDSCGNVYIAEFGNKVVRKVTYDTSCHSGGDALSNAVISNEAKLNIYPNPSTSSLTISSPNKIAQITITNLLGQVTYTHEYNTEKVQIDVADLPKGMYLLRINGSEVRKFVKR